MQPYQIFLGDELYMFKDLTKICRRRFVVLAIVSFSLSSCKKMNILNETRPDEANRSEQDASFSAHGVAENLKSAANSIKSKFGGSGQRLDYKRLVSSVEFKNFKRASFELQKFDISSLRSTDEKLAFWINVYNALTIDGIADQILKNRPLTSVWEISGFFMNTSYKIGNDTFSLDEIEHGILRANRRPPYSIFKTFSSDDHRLTFSVPPDHFDPRIHFALNCGSASCPPFAFYSPEKLDHQLELAKCGFIESSSALDASVIKISKIFDWYSGDFSPSVSEFIRSCGDEKINTALAQQGVKIKFANYDWHLNSI